MEVNKMKKVLVMTLAAFSICQSAFALTVYDPTNHTENLATKLEAIKQTAHQAEMVQNELKMLAKLNPAYQDETLSEIRQSIKDINDIRNSIDAIGTDFSTMMESFDEISPDYEDWNGASAERMQSRWIKYVRLGTKRLIKVCYLKELQVRTDNKIPQMQ